MNSRGLDGAAGDRCRAGHLGRAGEVIGDRRRNGVGSAGAIRVTSGDLPALGRCVERDGAGGVGRAVAPTDRRPSFSWQSAIQAALARGTKTGAPSESEYWSENMEGGCFNPLLGRPFDRSVKNTFIVVIHSEDKTCIDHDAEIMQSLDGSRVISIEVLVFVLLH